MSTNQTTQSPTFFGHPSGLFVLFFAEMWERFSYYGMRALLLFYMLKGFLGYGDTDATAVYGAYTALVYMMPFFGGILADRLLGARRAVIFGAILMAAGEFMLTVPTVISFYTGLSLLICGNGFFKPNISTIVGTLYPKGSNKRDSGFTIFYMGINLGAAMSPLLCGYVGETYGWHYGFGLATLGMLIGLIVFSNWLPPGDAGAPPDRDRLRRRPVLVTQITIISGALLAATGLFVFHPENAFSIGVNVFVAVALLTAAVLASIAIRNGEGGLISLEWATYLGTVVLVPLIVLLVSGFAPLAKDKRPVSVIPERFIQSLRSPEVMTGQLESLRKTAEKQDRQQADALAREVEKLHEEGALKDDAHAALSEAIELARAGQWQEADTRAVELERQFPPRRMQAILATVLHESSRPAGLVLLLAGLGAFGYLLFETVELERIARHRMYVVLILTFFSILFWAFFEQAGSSINNFTDRNVDRVVEQSQIAPGDIGKTIEIQPTQEQLGYRNGDQLFTLDKLTELRKQHEADPKFTVPWTVGEDNVGMGIADRVDETPASTLQAVNPIFILLLGLVFTALWTVLGRIGMEPSTPVKFAFGLLQLGLGFFVFAYAAHSVNDRGMAWIGWLFLGYLLHTMGELCLSPVGLSMITRLSPGHLVATVMGVWFLATAFSQFLAAIIAQFTSVAQAGGEGNMIPPPVETAPIYAAVFNNVAIAAVISALICFALSPLLKYWMHAESEGTQ